MKQISFLLVLITAILFFVPAQALAANQISVAIVIDNSTSMGSGDADPNGLRGEAAKMFVDLCLSGDEIAVVNFATSPTIQVGLTQITGSASNKT